MIARCRGVTQLLVGCSGSGGSSDASERRCSPPPGCADCGTLLLAVTDADGDFVSYSVDVLSVTLERDQRRLRRGTARNYADRFRAAH